MNSAHEQWHWQEPGEAWKGAGIYHITFKIPSCEPLFGDLVIPNNDPTKAWVNYSSLGKAVLECLRQVPVFHPEIQILHYCLMPDHLHSIWYVKKRMPRGILTAVRGFWQGAKKAERNYLSSVTPDTIRQNTLFTEMPHVRPMGQRRQLPATIRYIDMNPQRLATKRLKPGFFRVQDNIEIAGRIYSGVGNIDLLDKEHYSPVHVRHTMIDEAIHGDDRRLSEYMDICIDAVANKQVLILSPWPYDPKKHAISRAECVALNNMAEEISSLTSNNIRE